MAMIFNTENNVCIPNSYKKNNVNTWKATLAKVPSTDFGESKI